MKEPGEDLVIRLHREAVERIRREGAIPPPAETPRIPFTDLPPASPASPLAVEWDTYRQEVWRLLAEGKQSQFVLIKGRQVIGLHDGARGAGPRVSAVSVPGFPCSPRPGTRTPAPLRFNPAMPQLTLPVVGGELALTALVNVGAQAAQDRVASG